MGCMLTEETRLRAWRGCGVNGRWLRCAQSQATDVYGGHEGEELIGLPAAE